MKSKDPLSSVLFQIEEFWEELGNDYRSSGSSPHSFFRKISFALLSILNTVWDMQTDEIDRSEWMGILDRLFRSIAYTRDIFGGRGERQLTYLMLDVWYSFDPNMAVSALNCLFSDGSSKYGRSYGSFRDLIGLCEYIKLYSIHNYDLGTDFSHDPFFKLVVQTINEQLSKDWTAYNIQNGGLNNDFDKYSISNIAKWIPREKSKGDWLFSLLVKQLFPYLSTIRCHKKYIFAFDKCKRDYRRILSTLTRFLDVTEVKKCSKRWNEIDVSTIPSKGLMSSWRTLEYHGVLDAVLVSQSSNRTSTSTMDGYYKNPTGIRDLWVFIQEAKRLIGIDCLGRSLDEHSKKVDILNKQWMNVVEGWKKHTPSLSEVHSNILPVISIDPSCPDRLLYQTIADACLIIETSSIGRYILYAGHRPIWINLSHSNDFVSTIRIIFSCILPRLDVNYEYTSNLVSNVMEMMNSDLVIKLVIMDGKPIRKTYSEICSILDHPRYFPMMDAFLSLNVSVY